jgi:hypothetical protein
VRFAALCERLPRTFTDGDAAIAAIWQMVAEERSRKAERLQAKQAVLASMPPAIRAAFELDGEAFSHALREALQGLPTGQAEAALRRLQEAGVIGDGASPNDRTKALLEQLEPVLQDIAAAARGDETRRASLKTLLVDLDTKGFKLHDPVQRIWAGDRDESALIAGLDEVDVQLVRRVLELLSD